MKLLLVAALVASVVCQACHALDLGNGGVFNSPAAQEYWKRRGERPKSGARPVSRFPKKKILENIVLEFIDFFAQSVI